MEENKAKTEEQLGLIGKDHHDSRDYLLGAIQPDRVDLPLLFSLIPDMTSVQHQNWGTCTSHSVDGVKEFLDKKEYGEDIKLSQKFIYHNTKRISNLWRMQGDYLRHAIEAVVKYGACKEETFPDIRRDSWADYVLEEPSMTAYAEAEEFKAKSYWRIEINDVSAEQAIYNLKSACYRNKTPVCIGFMWASEFNFTPSDGHLPLPVNNVGGHAISFVGWEGDKLWFRNSHGANWGKNGYFYILEDDFGKYEWWDGWIILDEFYNMRLKIVAVLRSLIALYQQLIEKLKG